MSRKTAGSSAQAVAAGPPSELSNGVLSLILLVTAASVAIAGLIALDPHVPDLTLLVVLALIVVVSERFDVSIFGDSRISVSVFAILMAGANNGLIGVTAISAVVALADYVGRDKPFYKALFNAGTLFLAGSSFVAAFSIFGFQARISDWPEVVIPGILGGFANFVVNSGLVASVVALDKKERPLDVWNEKFRWLLPHYLVLSLLAVVAATTYDVVGLAGLAIIVAPLGMMLYVIRQYAERTAESVGKVKRTSRKVRAVQEKRLDYESLLHQMLATLRQRAHHKGDHAQRVFLLSMAIGEKMGITSDHPVWQDLRDGALLHDMGEVSIPDDILCQTKPLTKGRWAVVRQHPLSGYELLSKVDTLAGAAEVVLAHHERFDGAGYPRELAGEAIPLPARILAVADAFYAITSDRPYREARPVEYALQEIKAGSGSQFDPQVVEAFLAVVEVEAFLGAK